MIVPRTSVQFDLLLSHLPVVTLVDADDNAGRGVRLTLTMDPVEVRVTQEVMQRVTQTLEQHFEEGNN